MDPLFLDSLDSKLDSIDIAPTRYSTHFLKIIFVVVGGGFYSIIYTKRINQINKGQL